MQKLSKMKFCFFLFFVTVVYGATEHLKYFEDEPNDGEVAQQEIIRELELNDKVAYVGFSEAIEGKKFVAKDNENEIEIHVAHEHEMTLKSDSHKLILVPGKLSGIEYIHDIHFKVVDDILVTNDEKEQELCFSEGHGIHLGPHHCEHYLTVHNGHVVKSSALIVTEIHHLNDKGESNDIIEEIGHEIRHLYKIATTVLDMFTWEFSIIVLFIAAVLYYVL